MDGNSVKDRFALIWGGMFLMGRPNFRRGEARVDPEVQHSVTVSSFLLGKNAVTVGEFRRFIDETGYKTTAELNGGGYVRNAGKWQQKADASWQNPYFSQDDTHPVVMVSWYDAISYSNWLSGQEELSPAYTVNRQNVTWNPRADGYRLPTEAEWEYACRAGTTTPFNTGSNITTDQANYDGNYPYNDNAKGEFRNQTTPVGSFEPNPWGLYDMHGNVWEWCWDWYGTYDTRPQIDPLGANTGRRRVLRGGSWRDYGEDVRSASRGGYDPAHQDGNVGFRLVRAAVSV